MRKPEAMLALGPEVAITAAPTVGVPLFARCPPAHSVILGPSRLAFAGGVHQQASIALPAGTPHRVIALDAPYAAVAYLDARRYHFDDVRRLADAWRGFVPGHDDVRELFGDARSPPRRRLDRRLARALELLEAHHLSVAEAARRVDLSESRLTHLMTDTLGSPPRTWRSWFRLRRALGEALFNKVNLTQAAHASGFADSAHLTRTCKQLTGVRPGKMLPQVVVYV